MSYRKLGEGKGLWLSSVAIEGKKALTVIKKSSWSIISMLCGGLREFALAGWLVNI